MEENYKQLLRQRLKPVVLGGPDYEVCITLDLAAIFFTGYLLITLT